MIALHSMKVSCDLHTALELRQLANDMWNVIYYIQDSTEHLILRDPRFSPVQIYPRGVLSVLGAPSLESASTAICWATKIIASTPYAKNLDISWNELKLCIDFVSGSIYLNNEPTATNHVIFCLPRDLTPEFRLKQQQSVNLSLAEMTLSKHRSWRVKHNVQCVVTDFTPRGQAMELRVEVLLSEQSGGAKAQFRISEKAGIRFSIVPFRKAVDLSIDTASTTEEVRDRYEELFRDSVAFATALREEILEPCYRKTGPTLKINRKHRTTGL